MDSTRAYSAQLDNTLVRESHFTSSYVDQWQRSSCLGGLRLQTPKFFILGLLPGDGRFSLVFRYGVEPSFAPTTTSPGPHTVSRWEASTGGGGKRKDPVSSLKAADFIVADVTGNDPDVMLHIGYALGFSRHVVLISQRPAAEVPRILGNRPVIEYSLSFEGLNALRERLCTEWNNFLVVSSVPANSSLLHDSDVSQHLNDLQHGLSKLRSDSLLSKLGSNEVKRLRTRVDKLTDGQFDLRNQKPNQEIIEYFCDYLAQLQDSTCSFDTITNFNFWRAITSGDSPWQYLEVNIEAARKGATIRRIIVARPSSPTRSHAGGRSGGSEERLLYDLVQGTRERSTGVEARIETRILVSGSGRNSSPEASYPNLGLLHRGKESLLFLPRYDSSGGMLQTDFYSNSPQTIRGTPTKSVKLIDRHVSIFNDAWSRAASIDHEMLHALAMGALW